MPWRAGQAGGGVKHREESLFHMLEVYGRAPQPSAQAWDLAALAGHWQKAAVCSALERHRGFSGEGACPAGSLCARTRALGSCGAWPAPGAARWYCVTGCLSQVSLAPQDTSPLRCSGRIPMAKLWTCGLAVSPSGAKVPDTAWVGPHGMWWAVHPACSELQSLDMSGRGQGGGFT